jgi:hypothetical protein
MLRLNILSCRRQPWIWLLPILVVVLPGVAVVFVTIGAALKSTADWRWVLGGCALGILAAATQYGIRWADRELSRAESTEAQRLRVAMKDALQPLALGIAQMPAKSEAARKAYLEVVANQAAAALKLLLRDVDRLRAVVYKIDDQVEGQLQSMSCLAYLGRASQPSLIMEGTPRWVSALSLVLSADDVIALTPRCLMSRGPGALLRCLT